MKKRRKKNAKRLATELIIYYISEAWHDLDSDYYCRKMTPAEREVVKYHIHRYGRLISRLLQCRYRPNG